MAQPQRDETQKDIDRIAAFSDAIFAFSMTVLAVSIGVPVIAGNPAAELPGAMIKELPHFIGFVVGFLVVAMYWAGHHRRFRHMRRVDGRLVWLNIILLMFIAFMPVPTSYLGTFSDVPLAAVFFAVVQIATSFVEILLWRYATLRHFLDHDISPRLIRLYHWWAIVPMSVFALSIPIAFAVSAEAAEISWVLIWPLTVFFSRRYRDVAPQIYGAV